MDDERTSLAKRLSVTEVVAVFEQAEKDIRDGYAIVARARKALNEAFCLGDSHDIRVSDEFGRVDWDDVDRTLATVRRDVWSTLVERLELRRMLSTQRWNELERQLRNPREAPPINQETVAGMVQHFHSQLPTMLEEKIREVFEFLRPWRNDYKTNTQFEIGKRVIIEAIDVSWVRHQGPSGKPHISHHWSTCLSALESVFQSLDGQGSVTKGHYSELETEIQKTPYGQRGTTRYFAFRSYMKGSLHIEFLRPDLVTRLNQIAGGQNLKPSK